MGGWSQTRKLRRLLNYFMAASTPGVLIALSFLYALGFVEGDALWFIVTLACLLPVDLWLVLVLLRKKMVDGAPVVSQWSIGLGMAEVDAVVSETLSELGMEYSKSTDAASNKWGGEKAAHTYELKGIGASVLVLQSPERPTGGVGLTYDGEDFKISMLMERLDARLRERETLGKAYPA